jgi:hypothetical protein
MYQKCMLFNLAQKETHADHQNPYSLSYQYKSINTRTCLYDNVFLFLHFQHRIKIFYHKYFFLTTQ